MSIQQKILENALIVDNFIYEILTPREPKILYDAAKHLISAGGKRLRPYLVVKSCEIVGGDPKKSIPFAAALEVLHNFTLIHDDIMDNDDLRRGVPTVHALWGVPIAIASGDLLFAKVYQAIIKSSIEGTVSCERSLECLKRVTEATINLCEGQIIDMALPSTEKVSEENYISMVGEKTSSLFQICAEIGALVGGGTNEEVERLGAYAWNSGISFQIMDDILGVKASQEILGKPIGSDLREGKKTLFVIHALKHGTSSSISAIRKVLGVKNASNKEIENAIEALMATGSIDYAKEISDYYAEKAKYELKNFKESEAKKDLLELLEYFMKRVY